MPTDNRKRETLAEALRSLDAAEQALTEARHRVLRALDGEVRPNHVLPTEHGRTVPPEPPRHPSLDWGPPPAEAPTTEEKTAPVGGTGAHAAPADPRRAGAAPRTATPTPDEPWWHSENVVIRLLAVGGALITLGGVALLVVLAAQSGLLGPVGRVVLAYLLAAVLGAGAVVVHHRFSERASNTPTIITSLLFTALLTGLTTTWFVVFDYGWLPVWVGSTLGLVLFGLCLSRVRRWRMELPGLVLTVGVTLFMIVWNWSLVGNDVTGLDRAWPAGVPGLLLLVTTAGLGWRRSRIVAAGSALVATALVSWTLVLSPESVALEFAGAVIVAVMFTAVIVRDPVPTSAGAEKLAAAWAPALTVLVIFMNPVEHMPQVVYMLPLLLAVVMMAVGHRIRSTGDTGAGVSPARFVAPTLIEVGAAAAPLSFFIITDILRISSTTPYVPFLPAFFLAATVLAVTVLPRILPSPWPWITWTLAVLLYTLNVSFMVWYRDIAGLRENPPAVMGLLIIVLIVTVLLTRSRFTGIPVPGKIVLAVVALHLSATAVVAVFTRAGALTGSPELGFLLGHATVSVLWIALAAHVLLRARDLSPQASLGAGTLLAAAGTAKLILVDLGTISGVPRVLAFLISGVALLTIATLRARRDRPEPVGDTTVRTEPPVPSSRPETTGGDGDATGR
ncbi:hypothetical protein [Corynebacterium pygosceleis]|uniref:hypothetical protein n=1 Tax=Corynebacterium pygosceleis TaxID=2800406 RepID=UPI001902F14C|nr:hypothetical protein [Corynebacterium pygosceleis]MCK7675508.1 DUF2339 domain-containing protein [Corynebacterium pygosceleis]MCL0121098.1 DUF2339 domain-containing protein [Corynebacterium pygosceleis]